MLWQKPFLPLLLTGTRVCWVGNVLAQTSQRQQDGFIMCYHFQQLFFSLLSYFLGLCTLSFSLSSPMFWSWWRGGWTTTSLTPRFRQRVFFSFFLNIHISQCHRVTYCDLSNPSIQMFLSIILIVLPMSVGDVMVWPDHSQQYQQICPPDSLMSVGPVRKPEKDNCSVFCFLLYIHFLSITFFFSNWL